ncbi:unnamed protein product [Tilletia controversa]|uniref:Ribosomal RNA-processing protein 8 n=3 Tax=Tilletia TaxID=13289 RepID=A0A8X7SZG9_9BASI|nr:hypothetical protein CF336_g185 [Tilletia laevis]KAE8203738.1 hypothetical protein CF328_g1480 [Tilletia controversa]KAE8265584.1 hypothetical protein A4X03_0g163 [Tilletia caries]KAE8208889.1 hypothetical protein CF335_g81 [Tilletia laevis]KAE8253002.1 hypothetical protein A4X06_0g1780 [Tilletia controversa]
MPSKDKSAAAAEIDAIQAQLERNQSALADSILAKLGAAVAASPASAATPAKSKSTPQSGGASSKKQNPREKTAAALPRNSTLGLGAVPGAASAGGAGKALSQSKALSESDIRLKGRLVSKRKRGNEDVDAGDVSGSHPQKQTGDRDEDDDEDEAGRSRVVSQSSAKANASTPANDIFAKAAKKHKKAAQAVAAAAKPATAGPATASAPADGNGNADASGDADEMQGLTKAQRKKLRKKAKQEADSETGTGTGSKTDEPAQSSSSAVAAAPIASPSVPPTSTPTSTTTTVALTPLQKAMSQKLSGARFRTINETLYTHSSHAALELMQREPSTLSEYHSGFREQVKGWPKNPVDVLARRIVKHGAAGTAGGAGGLVVADLGAGEGPLASALTTLLPTAKVLSFDLLTSEDGRVVGADCARFPFGVPLPGDPLASGVVASVRRAVEEKMRAKAKAKAAGTGKGGESSAENGAGGVQGPNPQAVVDVVVFCLSLMPTNWVDMILEARRILRDGGEIYIAEVASRFNTLETFVSILERTGFKLLDKDDSNTHFTLLHLRMMKDAAVWSQWKAEKGQQGWEEALVTAEADQVAYRSALVQEGSTILKPCLYKRR